MGTVYLAERADEQFDQTAALKLMSAQLRSSDAVARFLAERQILANLNHPGIASLIDGGTTEERVPYLVMEFIDGEPIDNYCDRRQLSINERLELFVRVCEAVDYAHRQLIVHRDLKPANILVDSHGDPKLLDFGIAKLLSADAVAQAATRVGDRLMTPEYASPEQVRGEQPSVATDVYALGVLLYRLLTGHGPYGNSLTTAGELEAAIVEHDPERPSAVVATPVTQDKLTISAQQSSNQRSSSPERLTKMLLGDLDTIVLKALQKEPERRYAGAGAFGQDVQRYLRQEPVLARPNEWRYVAAKFVRRNTRAVSIAVVVLALITGLTSFYTWQLAVERDRATLAAAQSEQVSGFLTELFKSSSPFEADGDEPSAIELLGRGVERIDSLADQPQLQGTLYQVIGESYSGLGEYDTAIDLKQKAVELLEPFESQAPIALAEALGSLAETQNIINNYDDALANVERAIDIRAQQFGENHESIARDLALVGAAKNGLYKDDEALAIFERAIAMKRALQPEDDKMTLEILGGRAVALSHLGRLQDATDAYVEVIALSRQLIGNNDPNLSIRLNNLTVNYLRLGQYDKAYEASLDAVAVAKDVWPEGHEQQINTLNTHVMTLLFQGLFEQQDAVLDEIEDLVEKNDGRNSLNFAFVQYTRAQTLDYQQRASESATYYQEALDITRAVQGPEKDPAGMYAIYTGRALSRSGDVEAGERLLRQGLALDDNTGRSHLLNGKQALLQLLSKQGRFAEADTLLAEVVAAREKEAGDKRATLVFIYTIGANHLRRKGDLDGSLAFSQQAYQIARDDYDPGDRSAASGILAHARTLQALGRNSEALPLLREAHDSLRKAYGENNETVVEVAELLRDAANESM